MRAARAEVGDDIAVLTTAIERTPVEPIRRLGRKVP